MFKAFMGHAEGIDTLDVTQRAVAQLQEELNGEIPGMILVYANTEFEHHVMLGAIQEAFPETLLAGGTTSGEFSSVIEFSSDSIALLAFISDAISMGAGYFDLEEESLEQGVSKALALASETLDAEPSLCLIFPDVERTKTDDLLEFFQHKLGEHVPIIGGVPGAPYRSRAGAHLFYQNKIFNHGASLMLFSGPILVQHWLRQAWTSVSERAVVTESEGAEVKRIGDRTALGFYRHYLGPMTRPAVEFPLAVSKPGEKDSFIRGPMNYNPKSGSVTFAGKIAKGMEVGITEVTPEQLLSNDDLDPSICKDFCGKEAAVALAISCAARRMILGTRTAEEFKGLKALLPKNLPIFGCFSYGEIAPCEKGTQCRAHNHTMVVLILGQKGQEANLPPLRPAEAPGGFADMEVCSESMECLERKNRFLQKKLKAAEFEQKSLEEAKDMNTALLRALHNELKEVTHKLAASEEKHRRVLETTGEGFLFMDEGYNIQYANDAICSLLGYKQEEMLGRSPMEFMDEESRRYLQRYKKHNIPVDQGKVEEGVFLTKDGHEVPFLGHANTLRNEAGEVQAHFVFFADMTEHKKALKLAGEFQQSLLPREAPELPGLDIAGRSISCDEVGGDYFDYLHTSDQPNYCGVVVGDVSGHGVDASLLMSAARAILRMRDVDPDRIQGIVADINSRIHDDVYLSGRFITLFFLAVNPVERKAVWVRAGHDPALLYDPNLDIFEEMAGNGLPLGVIEQVEYEAVERENLPRNALIIMGTDGIWEAQGKDGEMFGKARMMDIIRKHAEKPATNIVDAVFRGLESYTLGLKRADDQTLVIVKLVGAAS